MRAGSAQRPIIAVPIKPLHGQVGMGHASRLFLAASPALRPQMKAFSLVVILLVILIFFVLHILRAAHQPSSSVRRTLFPCDPEGSLDSSRMVWWPRQAIANLCATETTAEGGLWAARDR